VRIILVSLLLAVVVGGAVQRPVLAQDSQSEEVEIIYFWSNTCSHCAEASPFLADLVKRYPEIKLTKYEIHDQANKELFVKTAEGFNISSDQLGVPFIIIGDQHWVGFSKDLGKEIENFAVAKLEGENAVAGESSRYLNVPLIGRVDLEAQSMVVSTLLISFVDGFNPCSIWVLSMLLALTLHTGSRRKVIIIGLIFLTVTAAVYALFIAGLFTVLSVVSFVGWIQVVVALVALFFAIVNIKDYFWYKEGLSFTISDEKKPGIFKRMRSLMDASQSFWGLAGATVVMAAGVSLVEFSCTAGFPVLWTNLLTAQKVGALSFGLLLLLYLVIYQLDEMAIFFTAVYTLKASRMEEKQGRILKLIGGVLMLVLAVVMIFKPDLMNSLSSSLVIFGIAFGLVLLILLLHRRILPAFGIWIGTEAGGHRRAKAKRHGHRV
jgi:thiol-disulfide isomerase/thioredoxin